MDNLAVRPITHFPPTLDDVSHSNDPIRLPSILIIFFQQMDYFSRYKGVRSIPIKKVKLINDRRTSFDKTLMIYLRGNTD